MACAGLSQGYGRQRVITDLDFAAFPGVLGLLGPNGAGKSTLLRTLATVAPPLRGTIDVCGERVDSERSARRARRNIGYLAQDFGCFPGYSVYEFVRYCAWLREVPGRLAHEEARRVIAAVGLEKRSSAKLKSLSGGMLQRAGIASALVGRPALVLLDEPTVGLDPEQRLEFRELIRSIEDTAVVISTHLVEDVSAFCDELVVFAEGRIVFRDTASALAESAGSDVPGDTPLERGYMTMLKRGQAVG